MEGHRGLKTKLTEMLKGVVVPEMSGVHEQCIYRVPQKFREDNPKAYTPRVVSIGPFHHKPNGSSGENNILEPMEELKLKYLKGFLNRTQLSVDHFVPKLEELENRIRSCYAGHVSHDSNDFLTMIIIDACFILEYFLRHRTSEEWKEKDPLLLKPWLQYEIGHDLILLENQLPFFVLEDMYNLAGLNLKFPSFLTITINYFHLYHQWKSPERVCPKPKHFVDLLRTNMLQSSIFDLGERAKPKVIEHVYSASKLSEAGLVFKADEEKECLLDITFDDGVLTMPCFYVHDTTETFFRNVVAFEDCHLPDSEYIAQYLTILNFLIDTEKDVSILVDKKIIVNWMGEANSVATMVNNLCKNISMPNLNSKYVSLCQGLNGFYEDPRNKYKAIFIHEYFNTPWKIASTIAAVLLLLLTLIQTISSVISII